jgi:hypothetical protein
MKEKHATQAAVGNRIEWTNARDENGDLVPPTADDLARLGRQEFEKYQARRKDDMDQRAAQREEEERFERFKGEFVRTGGAPADARSAFAQFKRDEATRAARRADEEAREVHATNTRAAI